MSFTGVGDDLFDFILFTANVKNRTLKVQNVKYRTQKSEMSETGLTPASELQRRNIVIAI